MSHPVWSTPASRRTFPVMTVLLVALNVGVYAWQVLSGVSWLKPSSDDLTAWGANLSVFTLTGDWWRLATSMFLHGGFNHLGLNMLALALAGPRTEHEFGRARMLAVYVVGGLVASCASTIWSGLHTFTTDAAGHEVIATTVGAGASGAIMALLGALLAAALLGMPESDGSLHRPMVDKGLLQLIVLNIATGFFIAGIDQAAHVGGVVGGFAVGAIFAFASHRGGAAATALRAAATLLLLGACFAGVARLGHREQFRDLRIQLQLEQAVRAHGAKHHGPWAR